MEDWEKTEDEEEEEEGEGSESLAESVPAGYNNPNAPNNNAAQDAAIASHNESQQNPAHAQTQQPANETSPYAADKASTPSATPATGTGTQPTAVNLPDNASDDLKNLQSKVAADPGFLDVVKERMPDLYNEYMKYATSAQTPAATPQTSSGNTYGRTGKEGYGKDSYVYSYSAKQLQNEINKKIIQNNKDAVANGRPEQIMSLIKEDGLMGYKTKEAMDKLGMDTSMYNYTNSGSSNSAGSSSSAGASTQSGEDTAAPYRSGVYGSAGRYGGVQYSEPLAALQEAAREAKVNDVINGNNNLPEDAPPMQVSNGNNQTTNLGDALSAITLGRGAQTPQELNGNPIVHAPSGPSGDGAYWNSRMGGPSDVEPLVDRDDLIAAYNQALAQSGASDRYDSRYYAEQGNYDMSPDSVYQRWYDQDSQSGLTIDQIMDNARAENSYEGSQYANWLLTNKGNLQSTPSETPYDPTSDLKDYASSLYSGNRNPDYSYILEAMQNEAEPERSGTRSLGGKPAGITREPAQETTPEATPEVSNERYDWRYFNEKGSNDMSPDAAFSRWFEQDTQSGLSPEQIIDKARKEGSYEGIQYANWVSQYGQNTQTQPSPERQSMTGNSMSAALENRMESAPQETSTGNAPVYGTPRYGGTVQNPTWDNYNNRVMELELAALQNDWNANGISNPEEIATDDIQTSSGTRSMGGRPAGIERESTTPNYFEQEQDTDAARAAMESNYGQKVPIDFNTMYLFQYISDMDNLKQQFPNYSDSALMDMMLVNEEMKNGQSSYYKWLASNL